MTTILLATLGFDERHVIRSLLAMGMGGVSKIVLLVPSWDIDERTRKAVQEIKNIAGLAGIKEENILLHRVDIEDFWTAVSQIMDIFKKEILRGNSKFKISLGGGLRALVIEAYTAALLVKQENIDIDIRIDIEARDKSIEINPKNIPICETPTTLELEILEKLQENPSITLTRLSKILEKPKTTIWKTVKKLEEKHLVEKKDNKYILTTKAKTLLKIYRA